MNKFMGVGILVIALILAVVWGVGVNNNFVTLEERVDTSWSQVENQYQRRADLIPNLVATVKGYAAHEQETLESVMLARSKATSTTINANNMSEETLAQFQQNQDALSSALSRLMVIVEKYPDLKANESFRELQSQLEGTENRITVARADFNQSVQSYNTAIRRLPQKFVASIAGFEKRPYFQAQAGTETAPQVDFSR